jgi:hypothetical protein
MLKCFEHKWLIYNSLVMVLECGNWLCDFPFTWDVLKKMLLIIGRRRINFILG